MSYVSKFNILGRIIKIKDAEARELISENTSNISEVQNKINNSVINLTEMIVLGDSWSRGENAGGVITQNPPANQIANALKLNLHNYGVGGSGYIAVNKFITQAQTAISDTSFSHDKVKYIFVIGGVNDIGYPNAESGVDNACETLVTLLLANFTNATIVLVPNFPCTVLPIPNNKIIRQIGKFKQTYEGRNVIVLNTTTLFQGLTEYMSSDWLHPNQLGYDYFVNSILNMLKGGFVNLPLDCGKTSGASWNTDALEIHRYFDGIRIYGNVIALTDITASNNIICTFNDDRVCFPYVHPYMPYLNSTEYGADTACVLVTPTQLAFGSNQRTYGNIAVNWGVNNTSIKAGDLLVFDTFIKFANY